MCNAVVILYKKWSLFSKETPGKHMEAAPRFERGVGDLQSHALPLGHAAR